MSENRKVPQQGWPGKQQAQNRPFCRVEFNPAKLGTAGIEELFSEQLDLLIDGGLPTVFAKSKVSRMDLALNLVGVGIGQLVRQRRSDHQ